MTSAIKWSHRTFKAFTESKHYQHSIYHVPFCGAYDQAKVEQALRLRLTNHDAGQLGGARMVGTVCKVNDKTISVEVLFQPENDKADAVREIAGKFPWR